MSMTRATLGAVVDFMNGGAWSQSEYVDAGIPVVRVSDVHDETIQLEGCKYLAPSSLEKYRKHLLQTGDVVVATVGSHPTQPGSVVGRAARVPVHANGTLLNQNAVRLRPLNDEIDRTYLGYLAVSRYFRDYIIAHARGSANQVRMAISLLKEMPIWLPSIERQYEIGNILSTYDDLIENNTRRIKILEQMAQMLYREWFVNFRFPGHEQVKMVESEIGLVPEGWTVLPLASVADVNALSIKNGHHPDEIAYIDIASVSTGSINAIGKIAYSDAPGRARRIVREGDTIWSTVRPNRKSFALILRPEPDLIASTGFAVLSPRTIPYSYLYFSTTTDDFAAYLTNHATGSAYPAVNSKDFQSGSLLVPPKELLDRFHDNAAPMLQLQHALGKRNQNLRTTRDLLLPKLVSGEISVEQIEEEVVAQMA